MIHLYLAAILNIHSVVISHFNTKFTVGDSPSGLSKKYSDEAALAGEAEVAAEAGEVAEAGTEAARAGGAGRRRRGLGFGKWSLTATPCVVVGEDEREERVVRSSSWIDLTTQCFTYDRPYLFSLLSEGLTRGTCMII